MTVKILWNLILRSSIKRGDTIQIVKMLYVLNNDRGCKINYCRLLNCELITLIFIMLINSFYTRTCKLLRKNNCKFYLVSMSLKGKSEKKHILFSDSYCYNVLVSRMNSYNLIYLSRKYFAQIKYRIPTCMPSEIAQYPSQIYDFSAFLESVS